MNQNQNQNQGFMDTDQSWLPNPIEDPLKDFLSKFTSWGETPTQNTVPWAQQVPNVTGQYGVGNILSSAQDRINGANPSFMDKMFGYQKGNMQVGGMAPGLLQGAGSIAQSILGWGQLGEAKRQNAFTQDAWQKQYDNQATLTNASQRDRQSARVAAAPGAYQSVGEYMQQNKVG